MNCKEIKNWQYIIAAGKEIHPNLVRRKLVDLICPDDPKAFDCIADLFIQDNYAVVPVPVELALSTSERTTVQEVCPRCRFVVTGVTEENAKRLQSEYGFTFINLPKIEKKSQPVEKKQPEIDLSVKCKINGKEYEGEEAMKKIESFMDKFGNLLL